MAAMKRMGDGSSSSESDSPRQTIRWHCDGKQRYYLASVQRDLFGRIEVWRWWGGIGSQRGGQLVSPVAGEIEAAKLLKTISRRRASRGYVTVQYDKDK